MLIINIIRLIFIYKKYIYVYIYTYLPSQRIYFHDGLNEVPIFFRNEKGPTI